jgi:hypothetical protein
MRCLRRPPNYARSVVACYLRATLPEDDIKQAINDGKEHRRKVLSSQLEGAAMDALDALRGVLADPDVPARDKIKAAEGILDRCGIAPATKAGADQPTGPVIIDVDFDERLARIVATGQT